MNPIAQALGGFMPNPTVEETVDRDSVTYTITGWRYAVDKVCQQLLDEYHPAGYGTYLVSLNTQGDGQTVAVVKRSTSCE